MSGGLEYAGPSVCCLYSSVWLNVPAFVSVCVVTVVFTLNGCCTCITCGGNIGALSFGFHVIMTLPKDSSSFFKVAFCCWSLNCGSLGLTLFGALFLMIMPVWLSLSVGELLSLSLLA